MDNGWQRSTQLNTACTGPERDVCGGSTSRMRCAAAGTGNIPPSARVRAGQMGHCGSHLRQLQQQHHLRSKQASAEPPISYPGSNAVPSGTTCVAADGWNQQSDRRLPRPHQQADMVGLGSRWINIMSQVAMHAVACPCTRQSADAGQASHRIAVRLGATLMKLQCGPKLGNARCEMITCGSCSRRRSGGASGGRSG